MTFAVAANEKGEKVLTMSKEYIEREVAKERLRIWITDCLLNEANEAADCFRLCIDLLDSIPAADVAPVRHGRWIVFYSAHWKPKHSGEIPVFRKSYKCSECCRRTIIAENYCPNCGAIMDNDEVRSQCKVNYNAKKGQL